MAHQGFDLGKITTPILVFLLKGRVLFPRLFLLTCKLTLGELKKTLRGRFPEDFVDLVALSIWVYINLKKKIGPAKAFEIMKIAVLAGGVVKQSILFDTIDRGRDFGSFIDQELEINKTGTTRWNELQVVSRDERRFELRITKCLFHEIATFAGVPEMTPIICQVDNAVFNSYMPEELVFERGGLKRRIADGADSCHFIWEYRGKSDERHRKKTAGKAVT